MHEYESSFKAAVELFKGRVGAILGLDLSSSVLEIVIPEFVASRQLLQRSLVHNVNLATLATSTVSCGQYSGTNISTKTDFAKYLLHTANRFLPGKKLKWLPQSSTQNHDLGCAKAEGAPTDQSIQFPSHVPLGYSIKVKTSPNFERMSPAGYIGKFSWTLLQTTVVLLCPWAFRNRTTERHANKNVGIFLCEFFFITG